MSKYTSSIGGGSSGASSKTNENVPIWVSLTSPSQIARKYGSIAPIWCQISKPRQLKQKFKSTFHQAQNLISRNHSKETRNNNHHHNDNSDDDDFDNESPRKTPTAKDFLTETRLKLNEVKNPTSKYTYTSSNNNSSANSGGSKWFEKNLSFLNKKTSVNDYKSSKSSPSLTTSDDYISPSISSYRSKYNSSLTTSIPSSCTSSSSSSASNSNGQSSYSSYSSGLSSTNSTTTSARENKWSELDSMLGAQSALLSRLESDFVANRNKLKATVNINSSLTSTTTKQNSTSSNKINDLFKSNLLSTQTNAATSKSNRYLSSNSFNTFDTSSNTKTLLDSTSLNDDTKLISSKSYKSLYTSSQTEPILDLIKDLKTNLNGTNETINEVGNDTSDNLLKRKDSITSHTSSYTNNNNKPSSIYGQYNNSILSLNSHKNDTSSSIGDDDSGYGNLRYFFFYSTEMYPVLETRS